MNHCHHAECISDPQAPQLRGEFQCRRRSQDGREAVLDANQRFYDAFQSCDPQVSHRVDHVVSASLMCANLSLHVEMAPGCVLQWVGNERLLPHASCRGLQAGWGAGGMWEAASAVGQKKRTHSSMYACRHCSEGFACAMLCHEVQAMAAVWGEGEHTQCIHPVSGVIAGREDVSQLTPLPCS